MPEAGNGVRSTPGVCLWQKTGTVHFFTLRVGDNVPKLFGRDGIFEVNTKK